MRPLPKDYWEDVWGDVSIPVEHRAADIPELHRIFASLRLKPGLSFIEIGCAPGKWMAYFAREFRLSVSGLEYAEQAYRKTVANMHSLSIPAKVYHADFLEFESEPYDVVASFGFIEHFQDVGSVAHRIVDLCKPEGGIVITYVPNCTGLNGWISRTFRPDVAAGHVPLSKRTLVALHQSAGLRTLYAEYTGGLKMLLPIQKNHFAKKHPRTAAVLNLPFRAWNRFAGSLTQKLRVYPRIACICTGIIYIGTRGENEA